MYISEMDLESTVFLVQSPLARWWSCSWNWYLSKKLDHVQVQNYNMLSSIIRSYNKIVW